MTTLAPPSKHATIHRSEGLTGHRQPNNFLSVKQMDLLSVISKKNVDGTYVDIDQILERLMYQTVKDSLHFSIRSLTKRGLIEKMPTELRRDRRRRLIRLTELGETFMSAGTLMPKAKGFVETPEETAAIDAMKALESAIFGRL